MDSLSHSELKRLKELHVTGNLGSSKLDICLVGLNPILNYTLWSLLNEVEMIQSILAKYSVLSIVFEYLMLVLPLLTVINYNEYIQLINATFIILIILLKLCLTTSNPSANLNTKYKPYITQYRSNLMLLTCICILAVDFNLFPKKFSKVETFGTSLMDVGVGAFVFSSGVVASRKFYGANNDFNHFNWKLLWGSFKDSIPLWVLGIVRLISVKGLEYQEHVTEYGVHWNFFFTLASLPPLCQLVDIVTKGTHHIGWIIAMFYQILLSSTTLEHFILESPRIDLISQNREGLFSLFGYLSLFLIGRDNGKLLFFNENESTNILKLILRSTLYFCLDLICEIFQLKNSRRLANFPYVTWVTFFNLVLIVGFYLVQQLSLRFNSKLFVSVNWNSLVTFLWANLLTGAVNMSVNTLAISDANAFGILIIYSILVIGLPFILYQYKIKLI